MAGAPPPRGPSRRSLAHRLEPGGPRGPLVLTHGHQFSRPHPHGSLMLHPNPHADLPTGPRQMASTLLESIQNHHAPRSFHPSQKQDLQTLARWGRTLGLERDARADLERLCLWLDRTAAPRFASLKDALRKPRRRASLTPDELALWLARKISPHPERFAALAHACKSLETERLLRESLKLQTCGEPWGRVVRLFWKGADGTERSRTYGLHTCKSRYCPACGRRKAATRSESIEKILELAKEWGFRPEHVRFLTLTVPNGTDIPTLRKLAHEAWAKLQRRRWWPKWVFGWFRGTECITGEDGHWNLHLHVVLLLWGHRISYARLWNEWETAVGARSQVDIDRLHTLKMQKIRRKGGLAAAARYVSKYISKSEVQALQKGPGGLAHHASATRGMRAFALGGGASVLRRMTPILLPNWARPLEAILEDAHLRDGMPATRQEEINPETGEVFDMPITSPALDAHQRAAAQALAGPLLQLGGTVGEACGPKKRWRRLGQLPAPSSVLTVKALEVWRKAPHTESPIQGLRQLIAHGDWRIFEEKESLKDGSCRLARVVLPGKRYAWREISRTLQGLLGRDPSLWGQRRKAAFQAWARHAIGDLTRRDAAGAILQGLAKAQEAAGIQARHITRALDTLRRDVFPDPEKVAHLTAMRDSLRRGITLAPRPDAWEAAEALIP